MLVANNPSLAFDSIGNPAISYFSRVSDTNMRLKFAQWNGSNWDIQAVDSEDQVGLYASLAFGSGGNPAISYWDRNNNGLKFAWWNGSSWDIQAVDSEGNVGQYTSLAFGSGGNPAISYWDESSYDLKYAQWNGSSWDIQTVDSEGNVGQYTSLAFGSSGNPAISYFDDTGFPNRNLKFAWWNGSSWKIETVDLTNQLSGYASLAFDSSDNPAISYCGGPPNTGQGISLNLKFARWNGGDWEIQTVEKGDNSHDVGLYTSLAFDAEGNPAISYQGGTYWDKELKFAKIDLSSIALTVEFTATRTSGEASFTVQFTDQSSGNITEWKWDFDNNGTVDSVEQNPIYTYDNEGTYSISLIVIGDEGSVRDTKADYIEVTNETIVIGS